MVERGTEAAERLGAAERRGTAPRGHRRAEPSPDGEPIDYGALSFSLGYVLRRVQLGTFNSFIRAFAAVDIRPAQFAVLTIIANNPGLKQSQISAALGIHRTNLVAMLDALERRGLARRQPVPSDRRSYALRLTAKGKTLMVELDRIHAAEEGRMAAVLGEGGREQLLGLMRGLEAELGADLADDGEGED